MIFSFHIKPDEIFLMQSLLPDAFIRKCQASLSYVPLFYGSLPQLSVLYRCTEMVSPENLRCFHSKLEKTILFVGFRESDAEARLLNTLTLLQTNKHGTCTTRTEEQQCAT